MVTVPKEKENPYRRIDAYMADFRYPIENKTFLRKRVGDKVTFGGTDYLVSGVSQDSLELADQTNQKRTSLAYSPNPAP
jgi:hypothetical protein